ncbi:MAG: F0F1 ATP synthase subunit B [Elusimicrobiota bacterium]
MDTLIQPDVGLMFWTIVSFLALVGLLRWKAWGPLLGAIEAREARLREERERAEKARQDSERIRQDFEGRLAGAAEEAKGLLSKAGADGEALRARIREGAEEEAKGILAKTRAQLDEERRRAIGDLRREVATLSVLAAERLVRKSVDSGVQKSELDRFFGELEREKGKN